ncbi:MAG: hypothetical protein O2877_00775, partial [bacterium]|nr:hypothetical protein [bacterium]
MWGTLFIVFSSVVIVVYLLRSQRRTVAPYVATPRIDRVNAFELLNVTSHTHLIELGCGKGDFLFDLARREVYGTGIELSFPLYVIA